MTDLSPEEARGARIWVDASGDEHPVDSMGDRYLMNAYRWSQRRLAQVRQATQQMASYTPQGEQAGYALDDLERQADQLEEHWLGWEQIFHDEALKRRLIQK